MPLVTLLTDYGPGTEHVGALHAVIAAGCPAADRIDLAHDIPAGDVTAGAIVLARLVTLCLPGVHLAVVDPGVGTSRRGVAVATAGGRVLVGPDNGLLAPACEALEAVAAVSLESPAHRREPVAPTFHGRDVFAPAAAFLASGGALGDLGPGVDLASLVRATVPPPYAAPGRLEATVVAVDRFGNVELLAPAPAIPPGDRLRVTGPRGVVDARRAAVFEEVEPGALLVFSDSAGHVAIAVRGGDAAALLGVLPGDRLVVASA